MIRIIVFWGEHWGPPVLGNYQIQKLMYSWSARQGLRFCPDSAVLKALAEKEGIPVVPEAGKVFSRLICYCYRISTQRQEKPPLEKTPRYIGIMENNMETTIQGLLN